MKIYELARRNGQRWNLLEVSLFTNFLWALKKCFRFQDFIYELLLNKRWGNMWLIWKGFRLFVCLFVLKLLNDRPKETRHQPIWAWWFARTLPCPGQQQADTMPISTNFKIVQKMSFIDHTFMYMSWQILLDGTVFVLVFSWVVRKDSLTPSLKHPKAYFFKVRAWWGNYHRRMGFWFWNRIKKYA